MNKKELYLTAGIVLIGILCVFLLFLNYNTQRSINETLASIESEYARRLAQERKAMSDEIYKSRGFDTASFKALSETMKTERAKTRKLEEKARLAERKSAVSVSSGDESVGTKNKDKPMF